MISSSISRSVCLFVCFSLAIFESTNHSLHSMTDDRQRRRPTTSSLRRKTTLLTSVGEGVVVVVTVEVDEEVEFMIRSIDRRPTRRCDASSRDDSCCPNSLTCDRCRITTGCDEIWMCIALWRNGAMSYSSKHTSGQKACVRFRAF